MTEDLAHLDDRGQVRMVDVSIKDETVRVAIAEAHVSMTGGISDRFFVGDLPKGDAIGVVRMAAILAAKKTSELVPLAHPISVESVTAEIERTEGGARIVVTTRATAKTGVEMEALTGASLGAIALYDMVKGFDKAVTIGPIQLLSKTGGKSGDWSR